MVNIFRYISNYFRRKRARSKVREEVNVVESMAKAKRIYKELILMAHPDRHADKVELAQSITEEINKNRHNYQELLRLKGLIEKELV